MNGVVGSGKNLVFNSWFGGKTLKSLNLCFMTWSDSDLKVVTPSAVCFVEGQDWSKEII